MIAAQAQQLFKPADDSPPDDGGGLLDALGSFFSFGGSGAAHSRGQSYHDYMTAHGAGHGRPPPDRLADYEATEEVPGRVEFSNRVAAAATARIVRGAA